MTSTRASTAANPLQHKTGQPPRGPGSVHYISIKHLFLLQISQRKRIVSFFARNRLSVAVRKYRLGSEMKQVAQPALFYESINDVLREVVQALGGAKKVGAMMRPQKLIDEAGRWVSDCLNPDRREKFDPEEVQFLLREARKIGMHSAINYICGDAGYSNPQPVEPEDEKARLMREFIEATKQATRNIERMEALSHVGLRAAA